MTLKGVMTIELTDADTGAVETVTEENMITESVNNILGLNPMGIFYAATGEYDEAVLWNGNLLPICKQRILGQVSTRLKTPGPGQRGHDLPANLAGNAVFQRQIPQRNKAPDDRSAVRKASFLYLGGNVGVRIVIDPQAGKQRPGGDLELRKLGYVRIVREVGITVGPDDDVN